MRYSLLSAWPTWWSRPRRPIFLYYLVLSLMRLSYSLRTQTGWGHLRACNFPSGMDTMTNWRWMLDMLSVVRSLSKLRLPFFKLLTTPCRLLGINFCICLIQTFIQDSLGWEQSVIPHGGWCYERTLWKVVPVFLLLTGPQCWMHW